MAESLILTTGVVYLRGGFSISSGTFGTITTTGQILAADGTSGAPAYSFASETTLGFWRSSAGMVTLQGMFGGNLNVSTLRSGVVGGKLTWPFNGQITFGNDANTIGALFKHDALPTVASGFGTSPAITAGSTALAGSIDVGTGGAATSGVINFNGTAFPSAPFVVVTTKLTNAVTRVSAISTTQMTLTSTTAWTANDIISWVAISSK